MPVIIRKARLEDASGIARVHVDSWRSSYHGLVPDEFLAGLSYEQRTRAWTKNLSESGNDTFLFVAEKDVSEIVGFVSAGPERENDPVYHGEVYAIYLLHQFQNQGIGRKLMETGLQELSERGFSSMLLWVLEENTSARKFYEALGGEYLRKKPIDIGGKGLFEVAYGWNPLPVPPP
jgi:ribosomal protein S18 acetylase RimI-like enzyme